jgi:uncharacterized protein YwqG
VLINKPFEQWRKYSEIEYQPILSVPFEQDMDVYDPDKRIETLINALQEKDSDAYGKILDELGMTDDMYMCSKLGGYPEWIQGGIRLKDNFEFLFQLDSSTDNLAISWGDCGTVYVFYNSITKEIEFELECY